MTHPPAAVPSAPSGFLGVLMLDTRFPRPYGDIGNAATFAALRIPVRYARVQGASPARVVRGERDPRLLRPFIDAASQLVDEGATLISTSCGFLVAFQAELAAALPVPVVSSSLLQCMRVTEPGIVTIEAAALSPAVLAAAGVPAGTPTQGVEPGCEFHRRIMGNEATLDLEQACNNVVAAARELVRRHPRVRTLVLECTNMPPYRDAVATATGRNVVDIVTLLAAHWRTR